VFVYGAGAIRDRATKNRRAEEKPKRQRLKRMFDKFGVPGVSLRGQTLLPSQITSSAMVGFGANRNVLAIRQGVSISLWGVLSGVLATLGIELALRGDRRARQPRAWLRPAGTAPATRTARPPRSGAHAAPATGRARCARDRRSCQCPGLDWAHDGKRTGDPAPVHLAGGLRPRLPHRRRPTDS